MSRNSVQLTSEAEHLHYQNILFFLTIFFKIQIQCRLEEDASVAI